MRTFGNLLVTKFPEKFSTLNTKKSYRLINLSITESNFPSHLQALPAHRVS